MWKYLLFLPAALALSGCEDLDYYDYGPPGAYDSSPYYGAPYGGYYRHRYRDPYYGYGGYSGYYRPYDDGR